MSISKDLVNRLAAWKSLKKNIDNNNDNNRKINRLVLYLLMKRLGG